MAKCPPRGSTGACGGRHCSCEFVTFYSREDVQIEVIEARAYSEISDRQCSDLPQSTNSPPILSGVDNEP